MYIGRKYNFATWAALHSGDCWLEVKAINKTMAAD